MTRVIGQNKVMILQLITVIGKTNKKKDGILFGEF